MSHPCSIKRKRKKSTIKLYYFRRTTLEALKLATDAVAEERERDELYTRLNPRPIETAPKDEAFVLVWLPITKVWAAGEFQEGIGFNGHYNYISDDPWEEPEWWMPMLPSPNTK